MARHAAGEGDSPDSAERIGRALTLVELAERAGDSMGELSAGQQQRVTFARAIVQLELAMSARNSAVASSAPPPTIALLADEPVSAMDLKHAVQTLGLLREAAKAGVAVVVVLHDLTLAARIADRALLLSADGTVAAHGTAEEVLTPSVLGPVLGIALASAAEPGGSRLIGPAAHGPA